MSETVEMRADTSPAAVARHTGTVSVTWWRRATQFAGLAVMGQWSFYGIFRCPFIVPYVSCQNCPVITCHGRVLTIFWGFWLLLPLSVLLFGRAFCSWLCPAGFASQLLSKAAPLQLRTQNAATRIMPFFKYLVLALVLYVWLLWGQPREAVPIRIGDFIASVKLTFEHANAIWLVRTCIVVGLLLSSAVLADAWCRFVCPAGGLLEIFKRFSLYKVYKTESCNDCDLCRKACEMGTRPAEANCTNCGDCLSVCRQDAIKIGSVRR